MTQHKTKTNDFKFIVDHTDWFFKTPMSGVFPIMWANTFNNGKLYPTPRQVIEGLREFLRLYLNNQMPKKDMFARKNIKQTYSQVFDIILETIDFPNPDKPFNDSWNDDTYGLNNYRSKGCFLINWLYTIEPPFYYFVNEACRKKDKTMLALLGPFACALYQIIENCE